MEIEVRLGLVLGDVLIFWPTFRLAVLIAVVLINKKACTLARVFAIQLRLFLKCINKLYKDPVSIDRRFRQY